MSREYFQSAPVFEIPEGATGSALVHTLMSDGSPLDISGAEGDLYFHCRTRSGIAVETNHAASFLTDGSDGKLRTFLNENIMNNGPRDLLCEYEVQQHLGSTLITKPFILRITKRAKVV